MAAVSRLWAVACVAMILAVTGGINFAKMHGMKEVDLRTTADGKKLEEQFNSWLDRTEMAAGNSNAGGGTAAAQAACSARYVDKSEQYPVFIVAVEGGGIYAASAASMLLAELQDRDPCFSQHVFAISAVSGGAIGATIFQAIDQARLDEVPAAAASPATISTIANNAGAASTPPADPSNGSVPLPCENDQLTANHSLEKEVCEIIEDDHFSPLVASIFPELLGFTRSGRAQELATSFQQSVKARDPAAAAALNDTFDDFAEHWSERSKAPALILNATWVENGFRAAFAPFPLHAIDGSLYSFADKNMPDDPDLTLIKAAVVSARFPAVLPPYSLRRLSWRSPGNAQRLGGARRPGADLHRFPEPQSPRWHRARQGALAVRHPERHENGRRRRRHCRSPLEPSSRRELGSRCQSRSKSMPSLHLGRPPRDAIPKYHGPASEARITHDFGPFSGLLQSFKGKSALGTATHTKVPVADADV